MKVRDLMEAADPMKFWEDPKAYRSLVDARMKVLGDIHGRASAMKHRAKDRDEKDYWTAFEQAMRQALESVTKVERMWQQIAED